jgi:hypothetical protein
VKHAAGIEALLELFWPMPGLGFQPFLWAKKRLPKARPLPKVFDTTILGGFEP